VSKRLKFGKYSTPLYPSIRLVPPVGSLGATNSRVLIFAWIGCVSCLALHHHSYGPNRYACINRIANQRFYQKSESVPDTKTGTDLADDLGPAVMVTSHRKRVRDNNGRSPSGGAQYLSVYKRHELQQFHQRKYQSNIIILSRPPVNAAKINKGSREKKIWPDNHLVLERSVGHYPISMSCHTPTTGSHLTKEFVQR